MNDHTRTYGPWAVRFMIRSCLLALFLALPAMLLQPLPAWAENAPLSSSMTPTTRPGGEAAVPQKGEAGSAAPLESRQTTTAPENEEPQVTFVDVLHQGLSTTIQGTATWMDSFFGNQRYTSELNESYMRFRYNVFLQQATKPYHKADYEIRIVLPQLRQKTHLVFAGTPKETTDFSAVNTNTQSDEITSTEQQNVTAAVHQTLLDTAQQNFIMRAGAKLHNYRPVVLLGPRYRVLLPLDKWSLRFSQEDVWTSNTGWESRSTLDVERPLPSNLFFRATTDWIWTEHHLGFTYDYAFSLSQPLSPRRAISYEWANIFQSRPVNELLEVDLRVRYRQRVWRDWLYFETAPQYGFPRTRAFRATAGILFRLEMNFGHLSAF